VEEYWKLVFRQFITRTQVNSSCRCPLRNIDTGMGLKTYGD